MKDNIEEIDQLIKDTLSKEEAAFYESLDEQNVFEMLFGLFKGKNAWFLVMTNLILLIFFGFFIYCCIQFFKVESAEELIKWGTGIIAFLMGMSVLKIYAWNQMDKTAILREMKRLEIQIMSLQGKVSD